MVGVWLNNCSASPLPSHNCKAEAIEWFATINVFQAVWDPSLRYNKHLLGEVLMRRGIIGGVRGFEVLFSGREMV